MPPATKRNSMPPPVRAIDAAKSSLQHLSDQERMITSRLLPPEDPVEAVFKPPEALPHSYLPNKPPKAAAALTPRGRAVLLKLPKERRGAAQAKVIADEVSAKKVIADSPYDTTTSGSVQTRRQVQNIQRPSARRFSSSRSPQCQHRPSMYQ